MQVIHHGGHQGVTGSCHECIVKDDYSLLIDCGAFQGSDAKNRDWAKIDFPLEQIKSLILTHVHIDHIGRVPYLLEAGFRKPIYCSRPTAELIPLMLEDAIRLGITRKKSVINQILHELDELIRPVPYGHWQDLDGGVRIRLSPAGHVLGSAYVEVDYKDQRVVFSGDLGAKFTPILREAVSPERADILVLESTYGDRFHEGREQREQKLEGILCRTLANKGVTIIPAFSLGRTQELLFELNNIFERVQKRQGCSLMRQVDVLVDSPLGQRLTEVYDKMRPYWSEEALQVLEYDSQPLVFENLYNVASHPEHLDTIDYLKKSGLPAIVIAGSGMCTGGRVVDYLKAFIERPETDVLFVGYQAYGTPGRYIQDETSWVRLDGKEYTIQAAVHTISGYSAHADQSDLLRFVNGMKERPKEIRLVHGEEHAKKILGERLTEQGYNVT